MESLKITNGGAANKTRAGWYWGLCSHPRWVENRNGNRQRYLGYQWAQSQAEPCTPAQGMEWTLQGPGNVCETSSCPGWEVNLQLVSFPWWGWACSPISCRTGGSPAPQGSVPALPGPVLAGVHLPPCCCSSPINFVSPTNLKKIVFIVHLWYKTDAWCEIFLKEYLLELDICLFAEDL